jgi:hypothetical protein
MMTRQAGSVRSAYGWKGPVEGTRGSSFLERRRSFGRGTGPSSGFGLCCFGSLAGSTLLLLEASKMTLLTSPYSLTGSIKHPQFSVY